MHSAEKRTKSCAKVKSAGERDRTLFIYKNEYYNIHEGLFNISYCHYNQWKKLEIKL